MRKETEKLIPLIPDIVIRDRAEVEAEERRQHAAENGLEGAEDSDDEPIISSRGRKAPGKKAKKGSNGRKGAPEPHDGTPKAEGKPILPNGIVRHDLLRAESDTAMEGSQNGFSTPPPGTITPAGLNGHATNSQTDAMEVDGFGASINGASVLGSSEVEYEDPEYLIWKQVTKKDRALVAAERHRLFKGDKLNPEEPALLRSKAGMRRWVRQQRDASDTTMLGKRKRDLADDGEVEASVETLAEGMQDTEDRVLPDYYDVTSAIPDVEERLQWTEDSEGYVIATSDETLRIVPSGFFTANDSALVRRIDSNLRKMQDTRKLCTKIGIVKQMQLQSQVSKIPCLFCPRIN
jgi:transcriptional activator SPT7